MLGFVVLLFCMDIMHGLELIEFWFDEMKGIDNGVNLNWIYDDTLNNFIRDSFGDGCDKDNIRNTNSECLQVRGGAILTRIPPTNTIGYNNITLSCFITDAQRGLEIDQWFIIEYSINNDTSNWDVLIEYNVDTIPNKNGNATELTVIVLPGDTNDNDGVSIRFRNNGTAGDDRVLLDSVSLSGLLIPTASPTHVPTIYPTIYPSEMPSIQPTQYPSISPTDTPTMNPSQYPTTYPSYAPTDIPTDYPSEIPTIQPTETIHSTNAPSLYPTRYPTNYSTTITNIPVNPRQNHKKILLISILIIGGILVLLLLFIIYLLHAKQYKAEHKTIFSISSSPALPGNHVTPFGGTIQLEGVTSKPINNNNTSTPNEGNMETNINSETINDNDNTNNNDDITSEPDIDIVSETPRDLQDLQYKYEMNAVSSMSYYLNNNK